MSATIPASASGTCSRARRRHQLTYHVARCPRSCHGWAGDMGRCGSERWASLNISTLRQPKTQDSAALSSHGRQVIGRGLRWIKVACRAPAEASILPGNLRMTKPPSDDQAHLSGLDIFLWPLRAASEAAAAQADGFARLMAATYGTPAPARPAKPAWTTANCVRLDLPTMELRDFSTSSDGIPILVCAPFALHGATLADFAPGHSL